MPWGIAGAFFDRQYGLLIVAPALALAIPGGIALWRRRTGDAAARRGPRPPRRAARGGVRRLVGRRRPLRPGTSCPSLGPLLLAAAMVAPRARDALAALGGIGLAVLGLAADAPRMLRNRPDGESLLLRSLSPDVDLNAWLPSFVEGGPRAPILAASLLAAAAIAWHWRGRGLVVGLLGYALVANGLRDRPLIDRGQATQRLLWAHRTTSATVRGLAIPFELPRRPWTLDPGEARNSRRVNAAARRLPGAGARPRAGATGGGALRDPRRRPRPRAGRRRRRRHRRVSPAAAGGRPRPRRFRVRGRRACPRSTTIAVVPEALVPRRRRAAFDWPELPRCRTATAWSPTACA